jgi:DNA-binding response OmpR family regulator
LLATTAPHDQLRLSGHLQPPVPAWSLHVPEPTVLIAEDDESVRDLMAFKLQNAGYRTLTADNGNSALALVHRADPDLIVLDVGMPGMDGLSVCHQLHSDRITAQIPVIIVSGRTRQTDIDLGYTVGADHYMNKPFNPADLVQRVRWLLMTGGQA